MQGNDTDDRRSREFNDADPPPFPWRNFLVSVVDGVIELVESLGVVAVLTPITRLRQEAVLAFCCSDNDPHFAFPVPDRVVSRSNNGVTDQSQLLQAAELSVQACGTHIERRWLACLRVDVYMLISRGKLSTPIDASIRGTTRVF
jgi:hypothetical protein